MSRRLFSTVATQSLSPALLLCLSLVISRWWGPSVQGEFIAGKSWLDLLVSIGCFGFPQSVIIAVNRRGTSRWTLYTRAAAYSAILVVPFAFASTVVIQHPNISLSQALAYGIGASGIVVSNIWRGILLTVDDGRRFDLITVVPAVAIAVAVAGTLILESSGIAGLMPIVCAVAGVIALLLSLMLLPPHESRALPGERPNYRELVTNGADLFIQALSMSAQTYFCYFLLRQGFGEAAAGRFSVALIAYQALGLPLQMISPMVLNRWSKPGGSSYTDLRSGRIRQVTFGIITIVLVALASAPSLINAVFGEDYKQSVAATQIVIAAVFPAYLFRIAALRMAAEGRFRATSASAVSRGIAVTVSAASLLIKGSSANPIIAASVCWLVGEIIAAAMITIAFHRHFQTGIWSLLLGRSK